MIARGFRVTHVPGLTTVMTGSGVLVGLVVGSGAMSLAYVMPHLALAGPFDTSDEAIDAVVQTALDPFSK